MWNFSKSHNPMHQAIVTTVRTETGCMRPFGHINTHGDSLLSSLSS